MKTKFDAILKIEKNRLDEYIKEINILKSRLNALEDQKEQILRNYNESISGMEQDSFNMMQVQHYARYIMFEVSKIDEEIKELSQKIEDAQDVISEQFNNVKKIELVIKQKELEFKKKQDKKEQMFLDEIKTDALKL